MKRTFAKLSLMSLMAGFFLFGFLLLSANRAAAQTYTWKQTDQAQQVMLTEVGKQQNALVQAPIGSPAYISALTHTYYYKAIYSRLVNGMDVPQAVRSGLDIFVTNVNNADVTDAVSDVTVTSQQRVALFNEAADLLK